MSDRVAMICGKTVHRDHFPFGVPDGTSSEGRPIGAGATDQVMSLYWRERTWRVHGTLTRTHSPDPIVVPFDWILTVGDNINNPVGQQASTITREAQLVLGVVTDGSEVLNDPDGGQFEVGIFGSPDTGGPMVINPGTFTFYPSFFFRVFSGSSFGIVMDSRPSFVAPTAEVALVGEFHFGGHTFPFNIYKSSTDTGTVGGNVIIEPASYWAYATKPPASLPVYDTSTGVAINDPLS